MKANTFAKLDGKNWRLAIVQARFNQVITDKLADGARQALKQAGVKPDKIGLFKIPGAFEIPLICQKISQTKAYHGIITIGAVIKGQTAHFEYISQAAINGVMSVMLKTGLPISLGIITAYSLAQAKARSGSGKTNKGYEAASALLEVLANPIRKKPLTKIRG
ncbi:MAG: 6,7-dimethyl-8-ribityllumazine synthase [Parcubacteria group bacterium]|nr:6,7-dimethyl-8-ribityllumazine synthase [Parcubacteria group bacterium]